MNLMAGVLINDDFKMAVRSVGESPSPARCPLRGDAMLLLRASSQNCEMWEDVQKQLKKEKIYQENLRREAENREMAKDYDSAIKIWEELGQIKEAARVRTLKIEQGSVKVAQKVVHGDEVTEIKDSVLNRSNIGGKSSKTEELREAKSLLDEGLINEDDYEKMKKEILK